MTEDLADSAILNTAASLAPADREATRRWRERKRTRALAERDKGKGPPPSGAGALAASEAAPA